MHPTQRATWVVGIGILVALGCGDSQGSDVPRQLAQATEGSPEGRGTAPQGSATISGTVAFSGSAPAQERIKMDADPQCVLQHTEPVTKQEIVVNPNGTLQHVFVYVKQGLEGRTFPTPSQPVILEQQGCLYHPHVFGVQVNQPLQILNSDSTLHNVNCKPVSSKPFNLAQPVKGMKTAKTFTAPEVMVKCVCNVHPWMAAYIGVLSHPYFNVTDGQGAFTLAGLPAGQYTIEAWHEKLGTRTQTVSVGDGESKSVTFEFKAP